jgi:hypothetical protein
MRERVLCSQLFCMTTAAVIATATAVAAATIVAAVVATAVATAAAVACVACLQARDQHVLHLQSYTVDETPV